MDYCFDSLFLRREKKSNTLIRAGCSILHRHSLNLEDIFPEPGPVLADLHRPTSFRVNQLLKP